MIPNELYLVTCNGYLDDYGARIFCIGVFESLEEANDAVNAQAGALRPECAITKLYLGDRHDMYDITPETYSDEYMNDLPLGGYVE